MTAPLLHLIAADAELTGKVHVRNKKGLELLYDRYANFLYAYVSRTSHDPTFAQSLLPEVFLAVWTLAAPYQVESKSLANWLLTVARGIQLRNESLDPERASPHGRTITTVDEHRHMSEAHQGLLIVTITSALEYLPTTEREIFEARYFQGLSIQSTAEQFGLSLEATNALLGLAFTQLQVYVGSELDALPEALEPFDDQQARLDMARKELFRRLGGTSPHSQGLFSTLPAMQERPEFSHVLQQLQTVLGARLTALIAGVADTAILDHWANGETSVPLESARRLRDAHAVVETLLHVESPQAIRAWFLGMNPELNDRAPALALADDPEIVAEAARIFAATG